MDGANNFLKVAVGFGVLFAGAGVGYHYGIYLPQIEHEKITRAEQAEKAKNDLLEAQKRSAKQDYSICIAASEDIYNSEWEDVCKIHGANNKGKDCNLPERLAKDIYERMIEKKDRCLEVYKSVS